MIREPASIWQLKTAPNQLTLLRMIFLPFIAIAIVDGYWMRALILFVLAGISDGLDGLLARWLQQRTRLGQYLDPIADKLLLSTMFLVLSSTHKIPWKFTILVFSRDVGILVVCAVVYSTTTLRDFSPSIYGKANTLAQVATLLLVLVDEVRPEPAWTVAKTAGLWVTFALTLISWLHYTWLVGYRLRHLNVPDV
jgi:cardiolipin synthase (CMP-forming)